MGWISVIQKMPEDFYEVIFVDFNRPSFDIFFGYHDSKSGWWKKALYMPAFEPVNVDFMNVTHWAELPHLPTVAESAEKGEHNVKEFAKKFCEKNKELLKRLADR